jgi:hypothetical protein
MGTGHNHQRCHRGWKQNGWQDLSPNTVRGYEGVWRGNVRDSIGRRAIGHSQSPDTTKRRYGRIASGGQADLRRRKGLKIHPWVRALPDTHKTRCRARLTK